MRVVFDVSVLIRAALRSEFVCRVLAESVRRGIVLLKSGQLVAEFAACARKPRLAGSIDWDLYNKILSLIRYAGRKSCSPRRSPNAETSAMHICSAWPGTVVPTS